MSCGLQLTDAVFGARCLPLQTAAAATQAQMRNSWVKQGTSDDLLTTRGTLHTNVSPHNSAGQATSAPAVPDTQFLAPNAPAGSFSAAASGSRLIPAGAPAGSGASGTHSFTHRPGFGPQPKSPARSPHNSPSAAPCSPRSPLGLSVRTRRASDTMAYVLALTERQESLTQAQAQVRGHTGAGIGHGTGGVIAQKPGQKGQDDLASLDTEPHSLDKYSDGLRTRVFSLLTSKTDRK